MAIEYTALQTFHNDDNEKDDTEKEQSHPYPPHRRRNPKLYLIGGVSVALLIILVLVVASLQSSLLESWSSRVDDSDIPGFTVSEYANYEYWRERIGQPEAQDAEGYIDHQVEHAESTPSKVMELSISKQSTDRAILMPTFVRNSSILHVCTLTCNSQAITSLPSINYVPYNVSAQTSSNSTSSPSFRTASRSKSLRRGLQDT
jgi:hypothetical protein